MESATTATGDPADARAETSPSRATNVFVVLMRGINVGGNRPVQMAALRQALGEFGFGRVATYIQSGNVVLTSPHGAAEVAAMVDRIFADTFGFESHPTVRDLAEWRRLARDNPFGEAAGDHRKVSAVLLDGTPPAGALGALRALATTEELAAGERVLYLHAPDGIGRSKLAASLDRLLQVPLTVRNWRTVTALLQMAEETAAG